MGADQSEGMLSGSMPPLELAMHGSSSARVEGMVNRRVRRRVECMVVEGVA